MRSRFYVVHGKPDRLVQILLFEAQRRLADGFRDDSASPNDAR